ncbi:TPA: ATP-binding protein [Klebsiella pneumoniae subsp. pneumoniae]|nr:ATP-binding protein [Klebsiella pneumoniae subsp. pneumoniae]
MSLELKFDPRTIEHLGVKMYSTLPPALAELISNSYDADSPGVVVEFTEINKTPKSIVIKDEGEGMSLDDIQNKFLVIGRNRRNDDGDKPSDKFSRLPTGKKGLGKLALFGLANEIVVDTIKDGLRNRFRLNWTELLSSNSIYNPKIELQDQPIDRPNRTQIQLSDLKRKSQFDLDSLADSLAKIFSSDPSFSIVLKKGEIVVPVDGNRRYKDITPQFKWTEKDLINDGSPYQGKVSLTLVTAETPIPPSTGLRGVTIFSRGKLVNAPEYFSESTSSHFFQYLTGSINADFIDLLSEDVISTNRQSINWDQPDMMAFREYLSSLIAETARDWRKKKNGK